MSCPGDNYIVPGANPCAGGGGGGAAGVTSLNSQTGTVNIVPSNGTIVVTQGGGQIGLSAVLGGNIVTSLNGAIDNITIGSSNSSVTVTTDTVAKTINLAVPGATPATVTNITGSGIATVTNAGTVFNVSVPAPPSATVTNVTGSGAVTVTPTGTVFDVSVPVATVTNVTGSGVATVTSASGVFNVDVPTPPSATVTNITGSGIVTVTDAAGVFNVDVSAVQSVKTLVGVVDFISSDSSVSIVEDAVNNTIDFTNTKSPDVTELNGLSGSLNIISSDNSILVVPSGTDIDITIVGVPPVSGVTSVEGLTGVIDLDSSSGTVLFNTDPATGKINMDVQFPTLVNSINGVSDVVVLSSTDSSITFAPVLGGVNLLINDLFTLTCIIPCTIQTLTSSALSIAPGATSYFDIFEHNPPYDLAPFIALRSHVYASINAPYTATGLISPNTLSYGFVWGTTPTTPPLPVTLTTNINNGGGTSGYISTAKLTSAELVAGTNTQLYLVITNTSAVITYNILELPNYILFTFTNSA